MLGIMRFYKIKLTYYKRKVLFLYANYMHQAMYKLHEIMYNKSRKTFLKKAFN